jgi:hypothetical protein
MTETEKKESREIITKSLKTLNSYFVESVIVGDERNYFRAFKENLLRLIDNFLDDCEELLGFDIKDVDFEFKKADILCHAFTLYDLYGVRTTLAPVQGLNTKNNSGVFYFIYQNIEAGWLEIGKPIDKKTAAFFEKITDEMIHYVSIPFAEAAVKSNESKFFELNDSLNLNLVEEHAKKLGFELRVTNSVAGNKKYFFVKNGKIMGEAEFGYVPKKTALSSILDLNECREIICSRHPLLPQNTFFNEHVGY